MGGKLEVDGFRASVLVSMCLLLALGLSFAAYVWAEKDIDRANEARFVSVQLADELRQSSDDLTRMIRTHVVTGAPSYAEHFREIIDIRNGVQTRPHNYERIYWDFVTAGQPVPQDGRSAAAGALVDRFRAAGFTAVEFGKLSEAKAKSDTLAAMELEAMTLMASGDPDDRRKAIQVVFGAAYHDAKASIMRPINDVLVMVDERTRLRVERAEARALALRYLSVFVAVLLVASLFHSYGVLNRVLGGSPAEVHGHIATIGGGDFSGGIRVPAGRENSVLGWLEETRQQLTLIEVQKRQAEASLREEEAKLRSLFTLSPLGIVLTDLDGRLIDGNGAFRRICGGDPAGGGALFGEDGGRLSAMLQSAGRYGPYERDHTRPDGSVVQLRLNGTLVTAADGRPYVWSIVEDISERRAYEEQLARSNTELEQFAYVASHDLQSPLRNIISFSQMLQRRYQGQLDEDAQEFIGFIIDNGKRMSSLISDLLQFSRVVHQGAAPTPMAAQQALEMALTSMERVILDTGATISAEPLPMVMGDPTQLASVFQNLIGNALKYRHPQRPPMVAVAVAALGDQYRFTIRDNGIGIAPAYHDKVFEMFERLEPNAYPEGSGIGLAICRRIIHRLGGTIGVESSSPEGTTFFFTLNAVPDHAAVGKDLETAV